MKFILHIDFNSYFATIEQQANPRLRGKPIGVTGGDRMERTVLGAASVEAKRFGVKTGMVIWQAKKICPQLILVGGDSDKYLECTKKFLSILKDYSPTVEVFSIDEVFLEIESNWIGVVAVAEQIKQRIRSEVGEWMSCSIGISYNKLVAKLAGSLYKLDGLVMIADEVASQFILDRVELDEVCGIGYRIKKRLNNMGIVNFRQLRKVSRAALLASFKSYGEVLYKIARGLDDSVVVPFYEKEEVKSIGHRHTLPHNTSSSLEIKQVLLKLTELVARRLRAKKLVGRTVSFWYRTSNFLGDGAQVTTNLTNDGLEIFKASWQIFLRLWAGELVRMVGVSVSHLAPQLPTTISFLPEAKKTASIIQALDKINDRFGEFTLQRAVLLNTEKVTRKANPFLADRRFKL